MCLKAVIAIRAFRSDPFICSLSSLLGLLVSSVPSGSTRAEMKVWRPILSMRPMCQSLRACAVSVCGGLLPTAVTSILVVRALKGLSVSMWACQFGVSIMTSSRDQLPFNLTYACAYYFGLCFSLLIWPMLVLFQGRAFRLAGITSLICEFEGMN